MSAEDLIQRGLDWLEEQRKAHMSRTVTYRRGADSVELLATVGETRTEVDDGYGVVVEQRTRDYIVAAADLTLGGSPTLPERGDEIVEERDGQSYVYEVHDLGSEPHYHFCDPSGKTLRIHTRHVSVEGP